MREVPDLIACEECDVVYRRSSLGRSEIAFCRRCGAELERDRRAQRSRVLPLAIAGLCMYIIANIFPILELEPRAGLVNQATLMGSVDSVNAAGMPLVAFLVLATTILFPLIQLVALIYLLTFPIRFRDRRQQRLTNGTPDPNLAAMGNGGDISTWRHRCVCQTDEYGNSTAWHCAMGIWRSCFRADCSVFV
jgi:uncharacterized paraquat-inducible protein A